MGKDDDTNRNDSVDKKECGECPCCPNHCPQDALQCGRGRNYFAAQAEGKQPDFSEQDRCFAEEGRHFSENGGEHHRHGGRGNGHRRQPGQEERGEVQERQGHKRDREGCRRTGGRRPMSGSLEEKLFMQIRHCTKALHHGFGGRVSQDRILMILANKGTVTQRELMDILGVQSGSVSEIVGKIEENGFLHREKNGQDRRNVDLHLTQEGKKAAEELLAQQEDMQKRMFRGLTQEEKEHLAALLDKLLEGWEDERMG